MKFHLYGFMLSSLLIMTDFSELYAASKWVTDILYVPVRSGASANHRILKNLKSGVRVEVIEAPEGSEYVKIRVFDSENLEGWVLSRHLIDEPTAHLKLEKLEQDMAKSNASQAPLEESLNRMKQQVMESQKQIQGLQSENQTLQNELAEIRRISSDKISTYEVINQLKSEQNVLQSRLEELKQQNLILENDRRNEGIKLGLIAVVLGGLAGLVLPFLKPRKKQGHPIRLR